MIQNREAIRVLMVEDCVEDVTLAERELRRAGYEPITTRVDDREGLVKRLGEESWDLVLSDFRMPSFSGTEALQEVRRARLDVPFIIVSGCIGEEVAVEAMKAGAQDYFRKDNLKRLGEAVRRELADAAVRREHARALEALQHAEERYRLIVENVQDHAIFMLDEEGRVASWNGGAARITGYTEAEVLGQHYALFFQVGDRADRKPDEELARARDHGVSEAEDWRVTKDGGRFWASCSVNTINDGKRLRGYSVVFRDSTKRKELLDDLRLAVQARDEFLSIASHELKTPLASIVLQVGALQRFIDGKAEAIPVPTLEPKVKVLSRQIDRLILLVDNLLDVTLITSGRLLLSRSRTDFREAVKAVLVRLGESVERSGSEVTLVADAPVIGSWDPLRLETVVVNLLSNALKYGRGRPIRVELTASEGRARLVVADEGIGILPTEQDRIFGRFERAVPAQHYGGFGIGLWVVRQIVDAHDGTIRVRSEEGRGSEFVVEIPLGLPPLSRAEATI